MGLIKDLVDVEIQILRCDNKIAISGDFIMEIIAGISNQGKEYKNPALHLAWVQKERLRNERYKILRLLDSTRADKAKKQQMNNDQSRKAVDLVQRALELARAGQLHPLPGMMIVQQQVQPIDAEVVTPEEEVINDGCELIVEDVSPSNIDLDVPILDVDI
jgi:hypothetical protein